MHCGNKRQHRWGKLQAAVVLSAVCGVALADRPYSLVLDGDTDRSGRVDGSAGERVRKADASVIVICNCDRDDPGAATALPQPDCFDRVINGSADKEDLEPLILRRFSSPPGTDVWLKLDKLSADDVDLGQRIRVFGDDQREILGPYSGDCYHLSPAEKERLARDDMIFHAEGLSFATSVTLSVFLGSLLQDYLHIETAPLIFTPQTQRPRDVYIARPACAQSSPANHAYVAAFKRAGASSGAHVRLLSTGNDAWVEDEIAWAYTESPRRRLDVLFHFPRNEELTAAVRKLLGPDLGWCEAYDYDRRSGNSLLCGGNVEVAPSTPEFPFGRLYYGSITVHDDPLNSYLPRRFDAGFHRFFLRQGVQSPIELHTNWLAVGHADEVAAFVPKGNAPGCLLLLASPKLAFEILGKLDPGAPLHDRYGDWIRELRRVDDLFHAATLGRSLPEYNLEVDARIFGADHAAPSPSSIKGILKAELGLSEADIVEVPALFFNDSAARLAGRWAARSLMPCAANSCSLGKSLLLADPFFPPFRKRVETDLKAFQLQPVWLDDWTLHLPYGGVHCNSSVRREAFSHRWWQKNSAAVSAAPRNSVLVDAGAAGDRGLP